MTSGDTPDTSTVYKSFAREAAESGSPVYKNLASQIAVHGELLDLIDQLPLIKRQPNLLLAAVRFLDGPVNDFASFKSWTLKNWEEIAGVMRVRMTQTNEAGRCASLLPLLTQIPGPLALLEVGASAGLCLYPDRYQYQYGSQRIGDPNSPLLLMCETSGAVPIPGTVPNVIWRGGIDLNPLDLTDATDFRWLESLIWSGQEDRVTRLRLAANIVRSDPPKIIKGDLNNDLRALVEKVPPEATLVIFHSAVLTYLSEDERRTFVDTVGNLPGHWISNEGPHVLPDVAERVPKRSQGDAVRFLMAFDGTPVAWTAPHGQSLEWIAS